MVRVQYKEKCMKCKKNYVLTTNRKEFLVCYDCQKVELDQPFEDKEMEKFFAIPEAYYKKSNFLRNIKINYFRYQSLSDKQKEFFVKVVNEIKEQLEATKE
jgi:hypothetical protein